MSNVSFAHNGLGHSKLIFRIASPHASHVKTPHQCFLFDITRIHTFFLPSSQVTMPDFREKNYCSQIIAKTSPKNRPKNFTMFTV